MDEASAGSRHRVGLYASNELKRNIIAEEVDQGVTSSPGNHSNSFQVSGMGPSQGTTLQHQPRGDSGLDGREWRKGDRMGLPPGKKTDK